MIYWAIQACKQSKFNIKVCVSTESEEISNISKLSKKVYHPEAPKSEAATKYHIGKVLPILTPRNF